MILRKTVLLFLVAGLILVAAGCGTEPIPSTTPTTEPTTVPTTVNTEPPLSPAEKYARACEEIIAAGNLIMSYSIQEDRRVGKDTYTEKVTGKASLSRIGQEDMTAIVEETLSYGNYEVKYTEVYCEEDAYVQVNDCVFGEHISPNDFVQRQLPGVLLEAGLYSWVTEKKEAGESVITFSNPSALEQWLHVPDSKPVSAEGKAFLNGLGVLTGMDYQAVFFRNGTRYSYTISVEVMAPQSLDLSAVHPEHFANVVWLQNMDAAKFLLQTVGNVYSCPDISCKEVETISSEAIPMSHAQESQFELLETEEDLHVNASYSISFSDYREQKFQKTQTESYENGVLTTVIDGGEPQHSESVTRQQMREYIEDAVLAGLFASKYIADAVVQDQGDHYRLEFSGNDEFIADMKANIVAFLQTDLDAEASKTELTGAGGYLTVDKATGMPTSMGLVFSQIHTIATVPYGLEYRMDQTLSLSAGKK